MTLESPQPPPKPKPSVASLLKGILSDTKELFSQELSAAKLEVQDELDKAKSAATAMGTGLGVLLVGGLLLAFMLVHGLEDLTEWPLWVCYGLVGGVIVAIGVGLLYRGKEHAEKIDVVPRQSVEAAKEDVRWISEQVTSDRTSKTPAPR